MKYILEEAKEKLPIDFITMKISKCWEEVGILKNELEIIKNSSGVGDLEKHYQDLIDAYLICIGQLEKYVGKKGIEVPEEKGLKEALVEEKGDEDFEIADPPEKVEKINDGNKVEVFTELPDYDVEVEQKGDKIEIELEPKEKVGKYIGSGEMAVGDFGDDEWPEPEETAEFDIDAIRNALGLNRAFETDFSSNEPEIQVVNNPIEDKIGSESPVPEVVKPEVVAKEPIEDDGFNLDWDDPVGEKITDDDLYGKDEEEKK